MDMLFDLLKDFPWFGNLIVLMGSARVVMKPLFSLIDAITTATPTDKDDKIWTGIKGSNTMGVIMWVLDYVASIKLPAKIRR